MSDTPVCLLFRYGPPAYSYDTLNRLVSAADNAYEGTKITASGAALTLQCWVYDGFGNRTYELVNPSSCPSAGTTPKSWTHQLSYGSPNRVTKIDGDTLQYDAAGNVIQDLNNKYVYDQEGRLCAVENTLAGMATQYVYDAEGTRVARGTISAWPASGSPCAAPTAANGFYASSIWLKSANGGQDTQISLPGQLAGTAYYPVLNTNVYLGNSLLATYNFTMKAVPQGEVEEVEPVLNLSFAFSDWLGTKRLEINSAGQAVNTWGSDPFGNYLTPGAGGVSDATDHHFTGQERDSESNNDYYGARYYASSMGRFMSPDPGWFFATDPADPQTWNIYAFARNNPLLFVDLDGYDCVYLNNAGTDVDRDESGNPTGIDQNSNSGECGKNGGYWVDGTVTKINLFTNSDNVGLSGYTTDPNGNKTTTVAYYTNATSGPLSDVVQGISPGATGMVELGKLYRNRITTTIGPQNQIDVSIGCAMTGVPKLALDLSPIGIVPDALDALQSGSLKPLYNSGDKANDAGNAVDTASKAAEALSKTLPFLKPIAKKLGPAGIAISLYKAGRDFHNCAR